MTGDPAESVVNLDVSNDFYIDSIQIYSTMFVNKKNFWH